MNDCAYNGDLFFNERISLQKIFYYWEVEIKTQCPNYNKYTMIKEEQRTELSPQEILEIAKKHKHSYGLVLEPATIDNRDFQLYNITLKRAEGPEDYLNFRRGLAYIDEIVDHKHANFTIAKKGLRKFHDLMPEFLDMKQSYFTNNKNQVSMKNIFLSSVLSSKNDKIRIYDTEKLNGENIQISAVYGDFWVIGTKNKTLLLRGPQDISQIKYKHEHLITIQIAKLFFNQLNQISQDKVAKLKEFLQTHTLVGELLNPKMSQHVVLYDKVEIIFFALVEKSDRVNTCKPVQQAINLCQEYGFKHAKYTIKEIKNQQQLIMTTLQQIVTQIQESTIKQRGEGNVLYIESYSTQNQTSENLFVCKVKTLEYRIYRKLREKLKIYIQKFNKTYEKSLKKYKQEVKQLVRQFKTPKPLEYYFEIAERAFQLCYDQTKSLARFVSVEFVNFLILCKNKDITKEKFMEIVNNQKFGDYADQEKDESENEKQSQSKAEQMKPESENQHNQVKASEQKIHEKREHKNKRVLVFVPMTIPATGKSTLFNTIKSHHTNYPIHIVSSDTIKLSVMQQKMKKTKSLTKRQAFEKSRKQANERFYEEVSNIYRTISKSDQNEHVFLIDKNHPENALKTGIEEYTVRAKKFANLEIKIVCLLPFCSDDRYLTKKSKYFYPFSSEYILTCLKRVSKRQQHETLEGSLEERLNIVIGFANMFRNFNLSAYNLGKHFDYVAKFKFFTEAPEISNTTKAIEELLVRIMMGSKIGMFEQHSELPNLVQIIDKEWNEQKTSIGESAEDAYKKIDSMFANWDDLKLENIIKDKKQ